MAYFDDNASTSVFWILNPSVGYTIQAISYEGLQVEIKIIDQILDSFSLTPGVVSNADTLVEAVNKLASSADTNYTGLHITSGTSSPLNLTALQRGLIFNSGVNGKTVKLPSATNPDVIPWVEYPIFTLSGLLTSNTIGVQTGESLNGTVNGTFALAGVLGSAKASAMTDGTTWFISQ